MCQACIEAELWLAYQEELAAKQTPPAAAAGAAGTDARATPRAPEPPAPSFACEEPPET